MTLRWNVNKDRTGTEHELPTSLSVYNFSLKRGKDNRKHSELKMPFPHVWVATIVNFSKIEEENALVMLKPRLCQQFLNAVMCQGSDTCAPKQKQHNL